MTRVRSASLSLDASPSTPRMVRPSTPVPMTKSTSVRTLASSRAPSSVKGVGTMFQTPRSRSMLSMPQG